MVHILVHGCQLMVPWTLIGNIHGVAPPLCHPGLGPTYVHCGAMVEGNREPTPPLMGAMILLMGFVAIVMQLLSVFFHFFVKKFSPRASRSR